MSGSPVIPDAPLPGMQHPNLHSGQESYLAIAYAKIEALHAANEFQSYVVPFAKTAFRRLCTADRAAASHGNEILEPSNVDRFIGACIVLSISQFHNEAGVQRNIARLLSIPARGLADSHRLLELGIGIRFRAASAQAVRLACDACEVLGRSPKFTDMALQLASNVCEGGHLCGNAELIAYCSLLMVGRLLDDLVIVTQLSRLTEIPACTLRAGFRFMVALRDDILEPEWDDPWRGVGYLQTLGMEMEIGFIGVC